MKTPPCRLYVLLARRAPVGVVFRLGPSKWTQLIRWNTQDDTFEPGQWFHGRVYVRRCDLSPDGTKLLYFVSKFNARTLKDREYTYAWTAISKPPYYTALALWPKGDCWHGGGSFPDDRTVLLNHRRAKPHPKHKPRGLRVRPNPEARGEDDPIYSERLTRDRWVVLQEWVVENQGYPDLFHTVQPEVRCKRRPSGGWGILMKRSVSCVTYQERLALVADGPGDFVPLDPAVWADWDHNQRLVVAAEGKLFGVEIGANGDLHSRELADFNSARPRPVQSPEWAKRW